MLVKHLWRTPGNKYIAYKNGTGLIHKEIQTADDLLHATRMQTDVWFACSVFDGDRRQSNVTSVNAFWADLDVGEGKPFPTQMDALVALTEFCALVNIPLPSVVSSGYGIHAYWLLDTPIPGAQWQQVARQLKKLFALHGFGADPARTSDSASLMRLPGTYNYKNPSDPQPVVELKICKPISLDKIIPALPPVAPVPSSDINAQFSTAAPPIPGDANLIKSKCAVMAHAYANQATIEEPLWFATLSVLRHCADGEALAHEWSRRYPDYDPDETTAKMQQLEKAGMGPTTCEHFRAFGLCNGCTHTVTSPVQLGRAVTPDVPKGPIMGEVQNALPTRIGRFSVGTEGVVLPGEDGDEPTRVLGIPLRLVSLGRVGGLNNTEATVWWRTQAGTEMTSTMPLTTLGEKAKLINWLLDHSITSWWDATKVGQYMKDYATLLQSMKDPEIIAHRFGWDDAGGFLLGDVRLSKEKPNGTKIKVASSVSEVMRRGLTESGSLQAWSDATAILDNPKYSQHAFVVLAAMAAPMLRLMNVQGAVLSVAGKSGTGKTTMTAFGLSAFGQPDSLMLSPQSTENAKGEMLRLANNLPVAVDDISGKYVRTLGGLIYMAANGRAKERATRDGTLKDQAMWQTIMISTTNNPISDLPEAAIAEAERRRVLEMNMNEPMERADAEVFHAVMRDNYGSAGRALIGAMIKNREKLVARAEVVRQHIQTNAGIPDEHRFGAWLIAAAMTVGDLARHIGAIQFDPAPAIEAAIEELRHAAGSISPIEMVHEEICAFINENHGKLARKANRKWLNLDQVSRSEVIGVVLADNDLIAIPAKRLRQRMLDAGISLSDYRQWITINGIEYGKQLLVKGGTIQHCILIPQTLVDEGDDSDG